jgi:hypothetical protein
MSGSLLQIFQQAHRAVEKAGIHFCREYPTAHTFTTHHKKHCGLFCQTRTEQRTYCVVRCRPQTQTRLDEPDFQKWFPADYQKWSTRRENWIRLRKHTERAPITQWLARDEDLMQLLDVMALPSTLYYFSESAWLHFFDFLRTHPRALQHFVALYRTRLQGYRSCDRKELLLKCRRMNFPELSQSLAQTQ